MSWTPCTAQSQITSKAVLMIWLSAGAAVSRPAVVGTVNGSRPCAEGDRGEVEAGLHAARDGDSKFSSDHLFGQADVERELRREQQHADRKGSRTPGARKGRLPGAGVRLGGVGGGGERAQDPAARRDAKATRA